MVKARLLSAFEIETELSTWIAIPRLCRRKKIAAHLSPVFAVILAPISLINSSTAVRICWRSRRTGWKTKMFSVVKHLSFLALSSSRRKAIWTPGAPARCRYEAASLWPCVHVKSQTVKLPWTPSVRFHSIRDGRGDFNLLLLLLQYKCQTRMKYLFEALISTSCMLFSYNQSPILHHIFCIDITNLNFKSMRVFEPFFYRMCVQIFSAGHKLHMKFKVQWISRTKTYLWRCIWTGHRNTKVGLSRNFLNSSW